MNSLPWKIEKINFQAKRNCAYAGNNQYFQELYVNFEICFRQFVSVDRNDLSSFENIL